MTQTTWAAVDGYITETLVAQDAALDAALGASVAAGLPPHNVSPPQGKMLELFARMQGARRVLEVGTLGGYSTIWLARALPAGGRLLTLELDPKHAEVARANVSHAGLQDVVEIRVGRAIDSLAELRAANEAPFDLVFIDADKPSNPDYFLAALALSRVGTLIVVDNVIREGAVIDADSADPNVRGVRRLNEILAAEPRVRATAIQTVGSKGYDGFTMALVVSDT